MKTANPKESYSVVRNQTFALENALVRAKVDEGNEPLKFYHKSFSRFKAVIINKQKKPATANIPTRDIPDLIRRGDFAYNKELENQLKGASETANELSLAYTVTIPSGKLKNKTPAQVLKENGLENGTRLLQAHYDWLKENLQKYPKNQEQMNAIIDAIKLANEGKLEDKTNTNMFMIYDSGTKSLRKQRADGMFFVYEIKMYWRFGNNYPLVVEIANYYAPVKTDQNGLKQVQVSLRDKSSEIRNAMYLSASEYANMCYMINTNMRTFENAIANISYQEAEREYQNNLAEAKGKTA